MIYRQTKTSGQIQVSRCGLGESISAPPAYLGWDFDTPLPE